MKYHTCSRYMFCHIFGLGAGATSDGHFASSSTSATYDSTTAAATDSSTATNLTAAAVGWNRRHEATNQSECTASNHSTGPVGRCDLSFLNINYFVLPIRPLFMIKCSPINSAEKNQENDKGNAFLCAFYQFLFFI